MFYFVENKLTYFLFQEEGKEPFIITQNKIKKTDKEIYEDNKYIGFLNYHFKDGSPSLLRLIQKAKFDQKTMIAITKQYNDDNCTSPNQESCIVFENQTPDKGNFKIEFSLYTGIQSTSYNASYYKSSKEIFPTIGGQLFLYNPLWSKNFGMIGDFSFSKMKHNSPIFTIPTTKNQYQIKYNFHTLSLKIGAKYRYSKFKIRPLFSGGFSYTNIIKNDSKVPGTVPSPSELNVRKNHSGAFLAAGMEYNIRKAQSIFAHFSYDFYLKSDNLQEKIKRCN